MRKLLETAVEEHLMADVPVASFLSGGIDSSVVTALAARALGPGRLQTFSVGFSEGEFDETQIADIVAKNIRRIITGSNSARMKSCASWRRP